MSNVFNWINFITVLIALMLGVSNAMALVIEVAKKIIGEDTIKAKFKSLDNFNFIFTGIISIIIYLVYLLFFVVDKYTLTGLDIAKLIVVCIIFAAACMSGAAIGYDKVIKTIKTWFHID